MPKITGMLEMVLNHDPLDNFDNDKWKERAQQVWKKP
jgi:hypothetical protein